MNILNDIISNKRKEVAARKQMIPANSYEGFPAWKSKPPSFRDALINEYPSIIAEFKRKSPSKGIINPVAGIYETIRGYTKAGVNAISVLTDSVYFGGSLCDLQDASVLTKIPLLRKDFVIDEYQLTEAKAFGASAILLIASVLTSAEVKSLALRTRELGMEVLFEVHSQDELDKWCPEIGIVGVNNRNLSSFQVNIENSIRLLEKIPTECIKVAESGISKAETVRELYRAGFNAFLIGETFMKADKPWLAAEAFILNLASDEN